MAGESRTGRRTLGATPPHRRRLSRALFYNTSDLQLQQEIKKLEQINGEKDMIIAEKDQEIESRKLFMHKMQREFYTNICERTQQNEEIISFNTRLSKELSYAREQGSTLSSMSLRIISLLLPSNRLRSSNCYIMSTPKWHTSTKSNENELQTRLAEIQDRLKRICEEKKEKGSSVLVNVNEIPTNVTRRTRNSSARGHSMVEGVCPSWH